MARTRKKSANRRQTEPTKHGDGYPEDTEQSTTLATTSQAARIAGVSPSTIVRSRAELGAIPGPNGAFLFNTQIVRQKITTIRRHQTVASIGPASGEVASAVFAVLKGGKHPSDIVIDLQVLPEVVLDFKQSYDEMHGRKPGESPRWRKCLCGADRAGCWCPECQIVLDAPRVERRLTNGANEVRILASVTWGRLPEKRSNGTALVPVELRSEWVAADSKEGRELLTARHPTRAPQ